MIKSWLILLRVIGLIQILLAIYYCFFSLAWFLIEWQFIFLFQSVSFALIAALPVMIFIIISNNFPDKFIAGNQKRNFNRLFLVNFLLISFLFGFVFLDYKNVATIASGLGVNIYQLDFSFFVSLLLSTCMLLFHFVILYGLYWLRSHINYNANRKQFDFEMRDENV